MLAKNGQEGGGVKWKWDMDKVVSAGYWWALCTVGLKIRGLVVFLHSFGRTGMYTIK